MSSSIQRKIGKREAARPKLEDSRRRWRSPVSANQRVALSENSRRNVARRKEEKRAETTLRIMTARVFVPLLKPTRYKGAKGGRGSGKSHFFAELLIERALDNPELRVVCIREVQLSLSQSVKRLIEDKIRSLKVGRFFEVLVSHINIRDRHGRTRGRIIFQGMQNHTADSIKSLEGYDIAWVEEAQSLSARSLSLLRPTIRKEKSELWFSWNPTSPKDPVDSLFAELVAGAANDNGRQPTFAVVTANWRDNPWFPDILRADMEYDKRRDPDRYMHVWDGGYQRMTQARVFRNWRVGTREEFAAREVQKLLPKYGGDFGFATDPTVGVRLRIDVSKRKLYVEKEVYKVGCEIDDTAALFDGLDDGEARKWPMIVDSARPETISYLNRHGYPNVKPARKGAQSVVEGIKFIQGYDVIIHPDCPHTADEFALFSYEVDEKTQEVTTTLADKKNHVIDSVRYALESTRQTAKAGVLWN